MVVTLLYIRAQKGLHRIGFTVQANISLNQIAADEQDVKPEGCYANSR